MRACAAGAGRNKRDKKKDHLAACLALALGLTLLQTGVVAADASLAPADQREPRIDADWLERAQREIRTPIAASLLSRPCGPTQTPVSPLTRPLSIPNRRIAMMSASSRSRTY